MIDSAHAEARARVWALAGEHAPHAASAAAPLVIDLDATLVTAHSDKESAAPTFKRGYGFHPLWSFADHGAGGGGATGGVRAGNAGSNTAVDHIAVVRAALRQLPDHRPAAGPAGRSWSARRRRSHPRLPGLAGRAAAVLPDRVHPAHRRRTAAGEDPRAGCGPRPTTAQGRCGTGPGRPAAPTTGQLALQAYGLLRLPSPSKTVTARGCRRR